ncbi:hypothetical protein V9T40_001405 [Parthenolecanium corni]|uniref:Uncharacterized protein n=1 Tax=Parthenolecanium corni TaxID=536013 RepID=A0AAN9TCS7_9HEMI
MEKVAERGERVETDSGRHNHRVTSHAFCRSAVVEWYGKFHNQHRCNRDEDDDDDGGQKNAHITHNPSIVGFFKHNMMANCYIPNAGCARCLESI